MDILHSKKIAILGIGNHGGGASTVRFVHSKSPSKVTLLDIALPEKKELLHPFNDIIQDLEIGEYNHNTIAQYDIVIKNPAIPRKNDIIKNSSHIETDISLYYQYQQTPTWMITGTKGKSSVCQALHNLLNKHQISVQLAGNITYSPLNILLEKNQPEKIILELSSFQIGDIALLPSEKSIQTIFSQFELLILTNIFPDHQNYYNSLDDYAYDKLFAFNNAQAQSQLLLPFSNVVKNTGSTISLQFFNHTYSFSHEQCYVHDDKSIPQPYRGSWVDNQGLWMRKEYGGKEALVLTNEQLPNLIPHANLAILANAIMANENNKHNHQLQLSLPQNKEEWREIFSIAHRKEFVAKINNRIFINDSAATIPQAIQLSLFQNTPIILITGGTNKQIEIEEFISAIMLAKKIILLDGTLTQQALPLLASSNIDFAGPFNSMSAACEAAYSTSDSGDTILLSPGCASFDLFLHEFDRGDKFKQWVRDHEQSNKK